MTAESYSRWRWEKENGGGVKTKPRPKAGELLGGLRSEGREALCSTDGTPSPSRLRVLNNASHCVRPSRARPAPASVRAWPSRPVPPWTVDACRTTGSQPGQADAGQPCRSETAYQTSEIRKPQVPPEPDCNTFLPDVKPHILELETVRKNVRCAVVVRKKEVETWALRTRRRRQVLRSKFP